MNAEILKIYEIAHLLGINCVIAGGAAVDFERATDIDVFVLLGDKEWMVWEPAIRLARAIGEIEAGPFTEEDVDPKYESDQFVERFYRAGKCNPAWSTKAIHITGFYGSDIADLLDTFDLSVHAWAIVADGSQVGLPWSTQPNEPIFVHQMKLTTDQRIHKLCARYGVGVTHVGSDT